MNEKDLRVIVTGGAGFIGTNFVDLMIERGIIFLNLDIEEPRKKQHNEFWDKLDILDKENLEKKIQQFQPTHICHLAAKTGMDIDSIDYFDTNISGVENLIKLSNKYKSIEKVLFTSSLLVCENGYIPINHDDYCPPNLYGESKMIGEQLVKDSEIENFKWSIVRPTSVWGPWCEGGYTTFFQVISKGLYMHPGKEEIVKPITYVGNTVEMMFRIMISNEANRDVFYLSDYPTASTREWSTSIQQSLSGPKIRTAPKVLIKFLAKIGDILKFFGYADPPITSFRLKNMFTGGIYPIENTKKICSDLPYSLRKGVDLTVNWLRSQKLI